MSLKRVAFFGVILFPIPVCAQIIFSPDPPIARPAFAGVPYSAQKVSETKYALADGTTLTISQGTQFLFRDSRGRTRTETPMGSSPDSVKQVVIDDPVAGVRYVLDADARLARRQKFRAPPARPPTGSAPPLTPSPARPDLKNERLGTQTMEGVTVEGMRATVTFAVGFAGNDRPFTATSEMWLCRELGETVLSKSSDPRRGENTTRLTHITRAEPDPSLFQPPPGYQIVDQQGSFTLWQP